MIRRGPKESVLIASGALLVLLTMVLILSLPRGEPEGTSEPPSMEPARPTTSPVRAQTEIVKQWEPDRSIERITRIEAPDAGQVGPGSVDEPVKVQPIPSTWHGLAPPADPPELAEEKDPARRARLKAMHDLAMARVKVRAIRHREQLLHETIEDARTRGIWSEDKLRESLLEQRALRQSLKAAESEVVKLGEQLEAPPGTDPATTP